MVRPAPTSTGRARSAVGGPAAVVEAAGVGAAVQATVAAATGNAPRTAAQHRRWTRVVPLGLITSSPSSVLAVRRLPRRGSYRTGYACGRTPGQRSTGPGH